MNMNEEGFIHAPFCCTVSGMEIVKWNHPMTGMVCTHAIVKRMPDSEYQRYDERMVKRWFSRKRFDVLACNLGVLDATGTSIFAADFICEAFQKDLIFFIFVTASATKPTKNMKKYSERLKHRILGLTGIRYEAYILNVYACDKIKCYRA